MRSVMVALFGCLTSFPVVATAQNVEFGVLANVAAQAVDNDEVVYNHPHLRLSPEMATLSAAHILQHDLQPATAAERLLREQIKIELYRRHLFTDSAERRQLMEPHYARMELEVANGLAECPQWSDEDANRKLGELGGRVFQHLNEGLRSTLEATGGPTQFGAISSTFANPPLRLDMVPANQFEVATASSWLLERATTGEPEDGWEVLRKNAEVQLQGVYTIRVKQAGWYDYYKLTLGAGDPQFERRPPATLVPEVLQQSWNALKALADQIVADELVELFKPKFEFKEEPTRKFVYSLGNSMLESQGPALNVPPLEHLVRMEMIRRERVTNDSRRAFWNPIFDRVTRVIREEIEAYRRHGQLTREEQDEFRDRIDAIYVSALTDYAARKGYEAARQEVKGVKTFTLIFQTSLAEAQRVYYIPATMKIFAEILGVQIPDSKWRAAYTGKPVHLSAGNYLWSTRRTIDAAEPFSESDQTILIDEPR